MSAQTFLDTEQLNPDAFVTAEGALTTTGGGVVFIGAFDESEGDSETGFLTPPQADHTPSDFAFAEASAFFMRAS